MSRSIEERSGKLIRKSVASIEKSFDRMKSSTITLVRVASSEHVNQRANWGVDISTGEFEDPQPEHDEAGRRQGEAPSVSPDRRGEIVRNEATSRWENEGGQ